MCACTHSSVLPPGARWWLAYCATCRGARTPAARRRCVRLAAWQRSWPVDCTYRRYGVLPYPSVALYHCWVLPSTTYSMYNTDYYWMLHTMICTQHWLLLYATYYDLYTTLTTTECYILWSIHNTNYYWMLHTMIYTQHWLLLCATYYDLCTTLTTTVCYILWSVFSYWMLPYNTLSSIYHTVRDRRCK